MSEASKRPTQSGVDERRSREINSWGSGGAVSPPAGLGRSPKKFLNLVLPKPLILQSRTILEGRHMKNCMKLTYNYLKFFSYEG